MRPDKYSWIYRLGPPLASAKNVEKWTKISEWLYSLPRYLIMDLLSIGLFAYEGMRMF